MEQSVINLALSRRQELRRQSELFFQLQRPKSPKLSFFQELQHSFALILIDLGTSLKIEKTTSPKSNSQIISPFSQG
jgi:hypothetical protein